MLDQQAVGAVANPAVSQPFTSTIMNADRRRVAELGIRAIPVSPEV
jgi:hypothetical protein